MTADQVIAALHECVSIMENYRVRDRGIEIDDYVYFLEDVENVINQVRYDERQD